MKKPILILCLFAIAVNSYGQLIINHNHRDITTLSESEINLAKSKLHIMYAHTSHGSQVTDGMTGLVAFANGDGKGLSFPTDIFEWNNGGISSALDLDDHEDMGDVGYYPQWKDNTISYLGAVDPQTGMGTTNPDVNVIMWSWCGQVDDKYSAGTLDSEYLGSMAVLETTYPNVKFVYMTGHLDHWDEADNKAANDSIRRHCLREGKILYDFADIESYNPDSTYFEFANDNCDYYSSTGTYISNWAVDWRNNHTEDVDWYSCGSDHSDALNANQKAYAAWHLFVEIAKIIVAEEIPDDLAVNDTIVANGESACFNAHNNITAVGIASTVKFESGSSVNLISENTIKLLPGFHAQAGSYTHAYISDVFCDDLPAPIVVAETVAVKSTEEVGVPKKDTGFEKQASLKVFPNPNKGQFTIQLENMNSQVQLIIFNAVGAMVYQVKTSDESLSIDLSNAQQGIYFVQAFNEKDQFTQKLIIE